MQSNNNNHGKKYIAPIVITILLLLYFSLYIAVCIFIPMAFFVKIIVTCIFLFLAGISIYVLVERIREIRSGEEDDLSKY